MTKKMKADEEREDVPCTKKPRGAAKEKAKVDDDAKGGKLNLEKTMEEGSFMREEAHQVTDEKGDASEVEKQGRLRRYWEGQAVQEGEKGTNI